MNKLRLINSFICVARAGNLTSAARNMGVTPSALSKQMSELEASVGAQLLIRKRARREVSLTPPGRFYFEEVISLTQRLQQVEEGLGSFEHPGGTLRVAAPKLLATHLVLSSLAEFRQKFEDVTIRIVGYGDDQDIAITVDSKYLPQDRSSDQVAPTLLYALGREAWVILARADSPLASIQQPSEITGRMSSMDDGSPGESWVFGNAGDVQVRTLRPELLSSDPNVLISAVQEGSLVILPLWAAHKSLMSHKFVQVLPHWDVQPATGAATLVARVPKPRGELPAVKAFITHLRRLIRGMQAPPPFWGA